MPSPDPEPPRTLEDKLIDRALRMMAPMVRLLVACGVTHPRFAAALKRTFFDAAIAELEATGRKRTDSAASLLSGLQRRDTRILGREDPVGLPPRSERPSLAQQVALRWASLPQYLDADENPVDLPIVSSRPGEASFTALAQSVSKDVHAASVLEELVRLGIARVQDKRVFRVSESAVPAQFDELAELMTRSTSDHIAAAVANVRGREPKFLEYSLFSDELTPQSAEEIHALVRAQAKLLFKRARTAAIEKSDRDRAAGFGDVPETRIRVGVYFYSEPIKRDDGTAAPPDKPHDEGTPR